MRARSNAIITSIVTLGFLFSFYARVSPDLNVQNIWGSITAIHLADQDDDPPRSAPLQTGTHQDEHGCYHDHQPLGRGDNVFFHDQLPFSACDDQARFVPDLLLFGIFHPPRSQFAASEFCAVHWPVNVSWRKHEVTKANLDRRFTGCDSESRGMFPLNGSKRRNIHDTRKGAA